MATVKSRKLDPIRKLAIVTIVDEFGAEMIVQHPLTLLSYNAEAEEQKAMDLMDFNVQTYKANAELHARLQAAEDAGRTEPAPATDPKG
jgi:hypothetical protein